jgi:hypothetical protein
MKLEVEVYYERGFSELRADCADSLLELRHGGDRRTIELRTLVEECALAHVNDKRLPPPVKVMVELTVKVP